MRGPLLILPPISGCPHLAEMWVCRLGFGLAVGSWLRLSWWRVRGHRHGAGKLRAVGRLGGDDGVGVAGRRERTGVERGGERRDGDGCAIDGDGLRRGGFEDLDDLE